MDFNKKIFLHVPRKIIENVPDIKTLKRTEGTSARYRIEVFISDIRLLDKQIAISATLFDNIHHPVNASR